jgi:hypothetical protein
MRDKIKLLEYIALVFSSESVSLPWAELRDVVPKHSDDSLLR